MAARAAPFQVLAGGRQWRGGDQEARAMNQPGGPGATIVLVEDDLALAEMLKEALQTKAYCVWHATTAAEAETLVAETRPELVILDLMLPDVSGLVLCANLKARAPVPVIVVSATRRRDDRILAFKLGADDFVAKPLDIEELLARVEAALRRGAAGRPAGSAAPAAAQGVQRLGELVIDHARCRVTVSGAEARLTPTEYRLLCALASRPDEVLTREELAQPVWGFYDASIGRSLEVHMRRLRAKLAAGPVPPPPIVTLRGFGYKLLRQAQPAAAAAA